MPTTEWYVLHVGPVMSAVVIRAQVFVIERWWVILTPMAPEIILEGRLVSTSIEIEGAWNLPSNTKLVDTRLPSSTKSIDIAASIYHRLSNLNTSALMTTIDIRSPTCSTYYCVIGTNAASQNVYQDYVFAKKGDIVERRYWACESIRAYCKGAPIIWAHCHGALPICKDVLTFLSEHSLALLVWWYSKLKPHPDIPAWRTFRAVYQRSDSAVTSMMTDACRTAQSIRHETFTLPYRCCFWVWSRIASCSTILFNSFVNNWAWNR